VKYLPIRDPWSRVFSARPGGTLAALLAAIVVAVSGATAAAQAPSDPNAIDLEQRLYQYRDDHRIPSNRNVAVFEFEYPDGRRGTIAIDSERHSKAGTAGDRVQGHSERRAARILASYGIKPEQVRRILSELQPCSLPGAYCARMLSREFSRADVGWLYEYGDSRDSRQRGNAAKRQAVNAHYAQQDAARNAMRVPGAKPPAGPLTDALARPGIRPGGIDFSSLELRYVSDAGPKGGGISYALRGLPTDAPSDPAVGLQAARRASEAFFAWLTLPPQSFWVNLNPGQPDRIIDPQFARTDAGHVLLDADFKLKRAMWPLTNPATKTGAEFWRRIDALYGNDRLKSNFCTTFRMWIEPVPATVRESSGQLYILDAPLTVKTEAIDLPPGTIADSCPEEDAALRAAKLEVFQQVIMPSVAQAVNTAPEFAELRRVYLSRVAAEWVRTRADRATPLGKLVDSGAIEPWAADPAWNPMDIFNTYLTSARNGDYSYQRTVEQDGNTHTLTYVMGGVDFSRTPRQNVSRQDFRARWPKLARRARRSLNEPATDASGEVWLGAGRRAAAQPRIRNVTGFRRARRAMRLRMTASSSRVASGGLVAFRLRVTNASGSRVANLQVCDRLPAELVYVRSSRRHRVRGGRHCWHIRRLAAGRSATIGVTARVAGGARGSVRNVATVSVPDAPALGARAQRKLTVSGASAPPPGGVTG
jgi:uncharacterized repeat protein (TIGR01451 family)